MLPSIANYIEESDGLDIHVCKRNRVSECTINCMCETHIVKNKNLPWHIPRTLTNVERKMDRKSSQVTFFSHYKIKKERDENFRSQETKKIAILPN